MIQRLSAFFIYLAFTFSLLAIQKNWILQAWENSPLDRGGKTQFLAGIAWCALSTLLAKPENLKTLDIKAIPFFVISLIGIGFAYIIDTASAAVYSSILAGLSLIWLMKGTRIAVIASTGAGLSLLGAPTAIYLIDIFRINLGINFINAKDLQLTLSLLIIALMPVFFLIAKRAATAGAKGPAIGYLLSASVIITGFTAGNHQASLGPSFSLNLKEYAVGHWLGADIELSQGEATFFKDSTYNKRIYAKADGTAVALLNISSDNIHQLHTPEYCWTGSGWQVTERRTLSANQSSNPLPASTTFLKLRREDTELSLIYWFSNEELSTGDIADLRIHSKLFSDTSQHLTIVSSMNNQPGQATASVIEFLQDSQEYNSGGEG